MRRGASLLGVSLLLLACKKDQPKGLPPAQDWQAPPAVGSPSGGQGGADPHAGVDMGAGGDPHAGVDMGGGGDNGGGADPHGGVNPEETAPKTLDKLADGRLALGPFALAAPKEWAEKPITSSMRAADFTIGGDAELVVYYFGEGGAGSVEDNLDRWLGQFVQADGKASRDAAKIDKAQVAGQEATFVSVSGRYVAAAMPGGGEAVDKADQALLAAIVASPAGPYYFKLIGSKKTLDASAARFRAAITSMTLR